jgi:threonine dehydratase
MQNAEARAGGAGPESLPVGRTDIEGASGRIAGWIRRTPLLEVEPEALGTPGPVALKLECHQHTGSFKPRGAFNRILSSEVPDAGVIAASGGNFGLAVAYAAMRLGHRAEVFVPESTPEVKIARLRAYGAEVKIHGGFYADALEAAEARRADSGALWTHAFDQPEMVAGNGTVGLEWGEQVRDLDTLLVAVGGAGLIGGIAAWFRGDPRILGVETEGTASLAAAMAHGAPVDVEIGGIAADSLGARRVGEIGFAIARRFVDRVVVVDDEAVRRAQRALWEKLRIIVEPGAAAPPAALLSGVYRPDEGERVGVLLCGANTDPGSISG